MVFHDRQDAAEQMLPHLTHFKGLDGIILAIPRGGVPIGAYLAKELQFQFDLLMTKKIGHPSDPEFAIGAVGLEDSIIDIKHDGISIEYINDETYRIRQELIRRYRELEGDKSPAVIRNRIAIIVDDGIATGRTILATLKILRNKQPRALVVAVPVASPKAAARIRPAVDELICLYTPAFFSAISQFYECFDQVGDEQVHQLLETI